MSARTLLVDIGNTRVKWAVLDEAHASDDLDVRWAPHDALPAPQATREADRIVFTNVASEDVATRVLASWPHATRDELKASAAACSVRNGYRDPPRLGADRWAALIGAHAIEPGRDLLVCGFGTATTIDLLARSDDGARFVGGLILPGAQSMRRSLARETARLPLAAGSATDFATDTDDAIESGIACAQAGAVERALRRARTRLGTEDVLVVLAGGDAAAIAPMLCDVGDVRIEPHLVLRGLAVVAVR